MNREVVQGEGRGGQRTATGRKREELLSPCQSQLFTCLYCSPCKHKSCKILYTFFWSQWVTTLKKWTYRYFFILYRYDIKKYFSQIEWYAKFAEFCPSVQKNPCKSKKTLQFPGFYRNLVDGLGEALYFLVHAHSYCEAPKLGWRYLRKCWKYVFSYSRLL